MPGLSDMTFACHAIAAVFFLAALMMLATRSRV
jgi:hypothetical protein